MRPWPDSWALAGPTDGSMIVSNRVCRLSGSTNQLAQASTIEPEQDKRLCAASASALSTPQTPTPSKDDASRSAGCSRPRGADRADSAAAHQPVGPDDARRTSGTAASRRSTRRSDSGRRATVHADQAGDAHAERVPAVAVLPDRVQHVERHHGQERRRPAVQALARRAQLVAIISANTTRACKFLTTSSARSAHGLMPTRSRTQRPCRRWRAMRTDCAFACRRRARHRTST